MKIRKQLLLLLMAGCMLSGCDSREQEFLLSASGSEKETEAAETVLQKKDMESFTAEDMSSDTDSPAGTLLSENVQEADEGSTGQDTVIYVDVCGAVCEPGVYELPAGSRVFEAISMAGGLTEDASAAAVNQAQIVNDGQQLYIPTVREVEETGGSFAREWAAGQTAAAQNADKVNINTADKETLMTLKGIGAVRAEAILSYRETHGTFASADDLLRVSGIKEGTLAKIRDRIVTG